MTSTTAAVMTLAVVVVTSRTREVASRINAVDALTTAAAAAEVGSIVNSSAVVQTATCKEGR